MGIPPVSNSIALPLWAQGTPFNKYIPVDVDGDKCADYIVHIQKTNCTDRTRLASTNVEIRDANRNIADPAKINVQFGGDAHSVFANVKYDPDGVGPKQAWVAASPTLAENAANPKPFDTARRYFSPEPDERLGNSGYTPVCVPCFTGLDVAAQGVMDKLPAGRAKALAAIQTHMEQLVAQNQGRPLEQFIYNAHGYDNHMFYEGEDGQDYYTLPASEVLKVMAPFMASTGTILLASCEVASGTEFVNEAKALTNPQNHDGRYAGLKIYAAKTIFGSPHGNSENGNSEDEISTFNILPNGTYQATSGLLRITGGTVKELPMEYEQRIYGGAAGAYTSRTFGLE